VIIKKLEKIIKAGLYIGLLTPLVVFSKAVYPFIFSKALFFQILIEILAILSLFYCILDKNRKTKAKFTTPLFWALLFFILINFVAAIFGENFSKSFWSNFERMDGLFFWLHLFVYFLILRSFFKRRDWQKFWWGFLLVALLISVLSLVFPSDTGKRLAGVIGNPIFFGTYIIFAIFIAAWIFFELRSLKIRIPLALFEVFLFTLLIFSGSRGPLLGLLAGILFIGGPSLFLKKVKKGTKISLISIILLFFVILGAGYSLKDSNFMRKSGLKRYFRLQTEENQGRLLAWKISIDAWREKPLLGWGRENYEKAFNQNLDLEILNHAGLWFDRPHNKYLEVAINAGLLGILAYLGILGVIFYYLLKLYRKRQYLAIFFSGLLSAYLVQNFFVFDSPAIYYSLFTVMGFLEYNYRTLFVKEKELIDNRNNQSEKFLSFLLIFIVIICFFYGNIKAIKANAFFSKSLSFQKEKSISAQTIMGYYSKTFETFPAGAPSLRLTMVEKLANAAMKKDIRFQQEEVLEFLANELKKNLVLDPYDVKSYLGLAKVYQLLGVIINDEKYLDRTKDLIFQALKIYPNRPEFYRELGKTEEILGNQDKAEQYYKKAYPLEIK
jgi:O-antigen ligase